MRTKRVRMRRKPATVKYLAPCLSSSRPTMGAPKVRAMRARERRPTPVGCHLKI